MFLWPQSCQDSFESRVKRECTVDADLQVCSRRFLARWPWESDPPDISDVNQFVDCFFEVLKDHIDTVDLIRRDVWTAQGGSITAEFVEEVLAPGAFEEIAIRTSALKVRLNHFMHKKKLGNRTPVIRHLHEGEKRLREIEGRRYSEEACDLLGNGPTIVKRHQKLDNPGQESRSQKMHPEPSPEDKLGPLPAAAEWRHIEIAFLSDERIQVRTGAGRSQTFNYAEFGFEDRRNGKPNRAWILLRELATKGSAIPQARAGKDRAMMEKRIQEIRNRMRRRFKIKGDPIPFNGNSYQTSFKVSRRPSFDT